ncbi:Mut7-C RNAse domain-containing protein [Halarsenatibacter silvermanii]|nr:Mut7-C RNAse domain-containing protein [Halarsenatibacter silvermanii]
MKSAVFRFYGYLKEILRREHKNGLVEHRFSGKQSVKDRIESMGVPHTEVDLIISAADRNEFLDFSYAVRAGDRLAVYPPPLNLDVNSQRLLQPVPPDPIRFVLDAHLGKLASYLRMMGFDAWYHNDYDDPELARIQKEEERVLLSRDRGLLQRKKVKLGHLIISDDPARQLQEVVARYRLQENINEFGRCPECNSLLKKVDKEQIIDRLKPLTKKYYDNFKLCPGCARIYWRGSHYNNIKKMIDRCCQ